MAEPIVSDFRIETEQAIKNVNALAKSYEQHNIALGAVVQQFGTSKKSGNDLKVTFTQINAEGQKVTTTAKQIGDTMQVMAVKVGQATRAQQRLYQQMGQINNQIQAAGLPLADKPTAGFSPNLGAAKAAQAGAKTPESLASATSEVGKLEEAVKRGNIALQTMNLSAGQINKAVPNLKSVQDAVARLGDRATRVRQIFDQIGAIGFATAIYRGISFITQSTIQSIGAAADYYRRIALIQTISQKSGESFDSWNTAIKRVANELGKPATEVADAAYDALSNQVINTTKDFNLLSEAIKLGKNTASDTGTALNLMSSIVNGFGKSTEQAESITSSLVTTVDLGRVQLSELNNTLGRSGALARNAAVSFEEVEAGIAVLTQSGIDSAEAVTLLNNVFVQIAKPNEALAAQFRKMGFETGKQAVETLTFAGVMKELGTASRNTADGLATFFPEIRGLRGASALTGSELRKFNSVLLEIEKSAGRSKQATDILSKNVGQKFQEELAKIQNFFTVDIGTGFLNGLTTVTEKIGGLANFVKELTTVVLQSAVAFGVLSFSIKGVKLAADFGLLIRGLFATVAATGQASLAFQVLGVTISKSLATFLVGGGAFAAGFVAISAYLRYAESQAVKTYNSMKELNDKQAKSRIDAERTANDKILGDFERSLQAQGREFGNFIRDLNKQAAKALEITKEAAAKTADELKNTFEIFTGLIRKNISTLESEQNKALDAIKNSTEEKVKFQEDQEQSLFERNLRRVRDRQAALAQNTRLERASYQQLAKDLIALVDARNASIRQKQVKAVDDKDPALAARLGKEIVNNLEVLANEKATINGITSDLFNQRAIEAAIGAETKRTNDLLSSRTSSYQKSAGEAAKAALKEREQLKTAEDLFKKITDFQSKVTDGSNFKVKYADDPNKALKDLDDLQKSALKFLQTTGALNNPKTLESLGTSVQKITADFQKQKESLADLINQTRLQISANQASQTRTDLANKEKEALGAATKQANELTDALVRNQTAAKQQIEFLQQAAKEAGSKNGEALLGISKDFAGKKGVDGQNQRDNFNVALGRLDQGVGAAGLRNSQVRDAANPNQFIPVADAIKKVEENLRTANAAFDNLESINKYRQAIQSMAQANLTDLNQVSQKLVELEALRSNFGKDANGQSLLPGLDATQKELQRIIILLQQINTLKSAVQLPAVGGGGSSGQVENRAFGGVAGSNGGFLADFFGGRYARGGDLIPTMLKRGETVLSEDISKKYYREIQAIRQNRVPTSTSSTSTTVGDINVNLGRGNTEVQARQVAFAMRRAARQGLLRG